MCLTLFKILSANWALTVLLQPLFVLIELLLGDFNSISLVLFFFHDLLEDQQIHSTSLFSYFKSSVLWFCGLFLIRLELFWRSRSQQLAKIQVATWTFDVLWSGFDFGTELGTAVMAPIHLFLFLCFHTHYISNLYKQQTSSKNDMIISVSIIHVEVWKIVGCCTFDYNYIRVLRDVATSNYWRLKGFEEWFNRTNPATLRIDPQRV